MAKTRPNIILPANTWVDIYTALNAQSGEASVTVGSKIKAENLGLTEIKAAALSSEPAASDGYNIIKLNEIRENDSGDPGAWFFSLGREGLVNITVME